MAKITKSTDKSGRTVYKIAGTKKFAFTLAKAKEVAAKGSTSTKAPARRTAAARKKPSTGSAWRRVRSPEGKGYSHLRTINGVDYEVWERIYSDGGEAIYLEVVSDRRRRILAPNGEDNGWASVDAAKKAAVRDAKTRKPAIRRTTKRKTATAKPKKTTSRRKVGTRTPKIIGRAYINRYGERVGPTRILGRTVDYAMKIVRTKGRDLKATPAHRKEIVAKYRKGLQKAGFLRGAATRSNSGRTMQYFKEVICEGGTGGGGCGSPLAIHKITQETFEAARGPKRSNAWFEHNEDEGPEVDGPFKVVLGYRLCRDCRE